MHSDHTHKKRISAFNVLLWCAGIAVLVLNLVLLRQNRKLKLGSIDDEISEGRYLVNLAGLGLDGRQQAVVLPIKSSQKMLIVTFSPSCKECRASESTWRVVTEQLRRRGWRIAWISRDPVDTTVDYCRERQIPLTEIYADPPYRTYAQLSLRAVPNTIVVGADGLVEKVWHGRLDQAASKGVLAYFGISATPASASVSGAVPALTLASKLAPSKASTQNR